MAYNSLSTSNLPDPGVDPNAAEEPRDYFETFLYTGNGGGLQVGDVIKKPADTTTISNSLVFNDNDSAYLSRTPASAGNRKTWTWSAWVKRSSNSVVTPGLFGAWGANSNGNLLVLRFDANNCLEFQTYSTVYFQTNQAFIDFSAWYHVVLAVDTTQTGFDNQFKLYVNGERVTSFATSSAVTANTDLFVNAASLHFIGTNYHTGASQHPYDGYMAEVHFVDGTAHAATDFGNFDANGIWIPKAVTGITYGTNGFYLDFSDNTSTTTLGADQTANGNDWTLNNLATTDQVTDSPTDNFATLDPSNRVANGTMSEGNLQVSDTNSSAADTSAGTISMKSGKYYFEFTRTSANNGGYYGIIRSDKRITSQATGLSSGEFGYHVVSNGSLTENGSTTSSWITAFSANDVCMIAYDADTGKVWFGRNGTWGGSGNPASGTNPASIVDSFSTYGYLPWVRVIGAGGTETATVNFGQRSFTYTPPTGFVALSENNITVDDQNLESPDFVWIKNRSAADSHHWYDSVRGAQKALYSNLPTTAQTDEPNGLLDFNKNGFTIGSEVEVNTSGEDYVAWCWKANGTGVSNTNGTTASTVSANTTAGFSIVKWTPTSSSATTVGHGLSQKPDMIIYKRLEDSFAWIIGHSSLPNSFSDRLLFNTDPDSNNNSSPFNLTEPTASVMTIGTYSAASGKDHIAYVFHSVEGFSKFGSYTGNGSTDGTFVYTGFRPAFVMVKRFNTTGNWLMYDSKVDEYNVMYQRLYANLNLADGASGADIDFVSNGFKHRRTEADQNASGSSYIYMAFAETPFKYATAR